MAEVAKGRRKLDPLKERLARLGLVTDWDFVLHLPTHYVNETSVTPIGQLHEGQFALVAGTVTKVDYNPFKGSLTVWLDDGTGQLRLFFTKAHEGHKHRLKLNKEVRVEGEVRLTWSGDALEIFYPKIKPQVTYPVPSNTLTPVYPKGESVSQARLRKRIRQAELSVCLDDFLSADELAELGLIDFKTAIFRLHHPPVDSDLSALENRTDPAWQRLIFEELLAQQVALRQKRKARQGLLAPVFQVPEDIERSLTTRFYRSLPFELTNAQKKVWKQLRGALSKSHPMSRLVQGDVGSGKTVIAALSACFAVDNGYQAALMAPTELLAKQHYNKISAWLAPFGCKVVFLSSKTTPKQRREALMQASEADIIIGTHALIQDGVQLFRLGLAIVDEQHRFGVEQRAKLRANDEVGSVAHMLMLSATPIPRTLAMSYLADIDVSVIDELPAGRQPITTLLYPASRKAHVMRRCAASIGLGAQVYWVCPLIAQSHVSDLASAEQTYVEICRAMPNVNVALLHGQMDANQKADVMERFIKGDIQLLVSTTVIEVGVDVANASVMVIDGAERFGLAQLHQLRGRVGRGSAKSTCVAIYSDKLAAVGRKRLSLFEKIQDGFELARQDLKLRGPGEILGKLQSGTLALRFADIERDGALLEKARGLADDWVKADDPRVEQLINRWFKVSSASLSV